MVFGPMSIGSKRMSYFGSRAIRGSLLWTHWDSDSPTAGPGLQAAGCTRGREFARVSVGRDPDEAGRVLADALHGPLEASLTELLTAGAEDEQADALRAGYLERRLDGLGVVERELRRRDAVVACPPGDRVEVLADDLLGVLTGDVPDVVSVL